MNGTRTGDPFQISEAGRPSGHIVRLCRPSPRITWHHDPPHQHRCANLCPQDPGPAWETASVQPDFRLAGHNALQRHRSLRREVSRARAQCRPAIASRSTHRRFSCRWHRAASTPESPALRSRERNALVALARKIAERSKQFPAPRMRGDDRFGTHPIASDPSPAHNYLVI